MSIEIGKYYRKSTFYSSTIAIFSTIVLAIIFIVFNNSKSEWFSNELVGFYSIIISIANAILFSFLATTMFLQKLKIVREKIFFSIASWFLLPTIWIGYIIINKFFWLLNNQNQLTIIDLFEVLNTMPYLFYLIETYRIYRFDISYSA